MQAGVGASRLARARQQLKKKKVGRVDALSAQLQAGDDVVQIGDNKAAFDFSHLTLKPDHASRPFWVTPTGVVFLEASSPLYEQARDFLVAICEPVSRPDFVHEYRLDKNALFAAASMGMTASHILSALGKMSKVPLSPRVEAFVRTCTAGYGKVKLVLRRGRYYVESEVKDLLRLLAFHHPAVKRARVRHLPPSKMYPAGARIVGPLTPLQKELYREGGGSGTDGIETSAALAETAASLGLQGFLPDDAHAGGGAGLTLTGNTNGGTLVARLTGEVDSDNDAEARAVMREREEEEAEEEGAGGGAEERKTSFIVGKLLQDGGIAALSLASDQQKLDELDDTAIKDLLEAVERAEAQLKAADEARAAEEEAAAGSSPAGPAPALEAVAAASSVLQMTVMPQSFLPPSAPVPAPLPTPAPAPEAPSKRVVFNFGGPARAAPTGVAAAAAAPMALDGDPGVLGGDAATAPADAPAQRRVKLKVTASAASAATVPPAVAATVPPADGAAPLAAPESAAGILAEPDLRVRLRRVRIDRSAEPAYHPVIDPAYRPDFQATADELAPPPSASAPVAAASAAIATAQPKSSTATLRFILPSFLGTSAEVARAAEASGAAGKPAGRKPPRQRGEVDGSGSSDGEWDDDDAVGDLLMEEEDELEEEGIKFERKTARKHAKAATRAAAAASKAPRRSVWATMDDADDDGGAAGGASADADAVAKFDEPGSLMISRKAAAALAARASEKAAAEGGDDATDETAAASSSFDVEYKALYVKQLLPRSSAGGGDGGGDGGGAARTVYSFEVDAAHVDDLKEVFMNRLDPPLPMMVEYEFRNDSAIVLPRLDMALRNPGELRPYQERCLSKMFGNGRARSGIIVLPCGAGKTFVGIAAACTIGRSTIVLCPNQTSVNQWADQFARFSTVAPSKVIRLTAKEKPHLPALTEAVVLLTTYSMIGSGGRRSAESAYVLQQIREREWGCMLLDEVHQAVAHTFMRALSLKAHCRLGLTATLVREDGRDTRLSYLLGPKLYEANWMDLTRAGYLANVQVAEVWCPMTPAFYKEYLMADDNNYKKALAVMNPTKCWAMDTLLRLHEAMGHKIIVFSESVFALKLYAEKYKAVVMYGDTKMIERNTAIQAFKTPNSGVNKIFLSRVGDVALDVPDANVIIQISSHFGSRLQEAQRMGRILRKGSAGGKSGGAGGLANAFFYTLISNDTLEVYFANKRRRYLVDQGYAYKVVTADKLVDPASVPSLAPLVEAEAQRLLRLGGVVERGTTWAAQLAQGIPVNFDEVATGAAVAAAAAMPAAFDLGGGDGGVEEGGGAPAMLAAPRPSAATAAALAASTPGMAWSSSLGMEALRRTASFASSLEEQLKVLETVQRGDFVGIDAREDARAAALAGGVDDAGDSDYEVDDPAKVAKKARRGGAGAAAGAPAAVAGGGGILRRAVQGGLGALAGGAGLKYVEFTSEVSGRDALAQTDAAREAERRASAAAAAVGAPKARADVNAALDRL